MEKTIKTSLIIAGAGNGERAKLNKNKLLYKVKEKTVLELTLSTFLKSGLIDEYIVTASEKDEEEFRSILPDGVTVVRGGKTRTESVINALSLVSGKVVLIHDGARPFVSEKIIKDCIESAIKYGSGITAIPSRDTILSSKDGIISEYLGKGGLYSVQTPQAFRSDLIKKAYEKVGGRIFNDDGEVYKEFIGDTHVVEGEIKNVKLTYPEDFENLNILPECRVGTGFDCHKLVEGRKLILGGIEIPHDKGLLGHSDADVLTHAIMDAILSSVSMRDIGYWFSDKDPKYKDADSLMLLQKVLEIIKEKGYKVTTVSAVIMAQKPKLLNYIPLITQKLANTLEIDITSVGIGATTLEGLGFVGREEGICASATATTVKI